MHDALRGMVIAIKDSLLMVVLFACLFRFPIPFIGYVGPFGEVSAYSIHMVVPLLIAWVFYGLFGGFFILASCGAMTGMIIGHIYSESDYKNRMISVWTIVISTIPIFVLSILDFIIGPW